MEQRAADARRETAEHQSALAEFQTLLAETVHDPAATWRQSWPILQGDPQGRGRNEYLEPRAAEQVFRAHVRHLENEAVQAFVNLLDDRLLVRTYWMMLHGETYTISLVQPSRIAVLFLYPP